MLAIIYLCYRYSLRNGHETTSRFLTCLFIPAWDDLIRCVEWLCASWVHPIWNKNSALELREVIPCTFLSFAELYRDPKWLRLLQIRLVTIKLYDFRTSPLIRIHIPAIILTLYSILVFKIELAGLYSELLIIKITPKSRTIGRLNETNLEPWCSD